MTGREAYQILVVGSCRPDGRWENQRIRNKALCLPIDCLTEIKKLSSNEIRAISSAREYYNNIETILIDGATAFSSVYDLVLFYYICRPHRLAGDSFVYRGQRNHRWHLLPSLARDSAKVEEDIAATVSWIKQQLSDVSSLHNFEPLELIAIAQHYGQRTCLLDYTWDPQVAAAFACLGYRSDSSEGFGAIYDLSVREATLLAPRLDLAAGGLIKVNLPQIPRIRRQRGLFFGAFNATAFANLAACDRCLFRHGDDSELFISNFQLSEGDLLPEPIVDVNVLNRAHALGNDTFGDANTIEEILSDWAMKCLNPPSWRDYYRLAEAYVGRRPPLNERQMKRIRVFCRWFADLQALELPKDALALSRLYDAVVEIRSYYESSCECRSYLSQFVNRINQEILPKNLDFLRGSLKRARSAEHYRFSEDGPYVSSDRALWVDDGV